ncbi:hypothetical protein NDN08_002755 [Rhodosorus marinus]|uniref:Uncharacterized protein n=1 Tax=Rhodosorus marinus TaxID=101924 RepID=A0AAV8UYX1_9RHOD|nr:hypothetical protein NDN08_002755 [Rhodosorus marinus]
MNRPLLLCVVGVVFGLALARVNADDVLPGLKQNLKELMKVVQTEDEKVKQAVDAVFQTSNYRLLDLEKQVVDLEGKLVEIRKQQAVNAQKIVQSQGMVQENMNNKMMVKDHVEKLQTERNLIEENAKSLKARMEAETNKLDSAKASNDEHLKSLQTLVHALEDDMHAIRQLKNPALESIFVNQAVEIGDYLQSPLTTDLLLASVDIASSTYNTTAEMIPIESRRVPMIVKVPLILLIVGIITVAMMRLVGGIVTPKAALINSWILMIAACIHMFVALRDLSIASQQASVALLTVQLLMLCCAWFAIVSSPILMISSRDRREKVVLVVQYIVILLMTVFYHRMILLYSIRGQLLDTMFVRRSGLACIAAMAVAGASTYLLSSRGRGRKRQTP